MTPIRVVVQLIPMLQRVPRRGVPVHSGIHVVVVCGGTRVLEARQARIVLYGPFLLQWHPSGEERRAKRRASVVGAADRQRARAVPMSLPEPARLRCDDVRLDLRNKRQHGRFATPAGDSTWTSLSSKQRRPQSAESATEGRDGDRGGGNEGKMRSGSNTMAEGGEGSLA